MNPEIRNFLAKTEIKNVLNLIEYEALLRTIPPHRGNI